MHSGTRTGWWRVFRLTRLWARHSARGPPRGGHPDRALRCLEEVAPSAPSASLSCWRQRPLPPRGPRPRQPPCWGAPPAGPRARRAVPTRGAVGGGDWIGVLRSALPNRGARPPTIPASRCSTPETPHSCSRGPSPQATSHVPLTNPDPQRRWSPRDRAAGSRSAPRRSGPCPRSRCAGRRQRS